MLLHCSLIRFFVCQTYIVILSELCLFETERIVFLGGCTDGCYLLCNIINCTCHCIPFLLLVLLYWITTLSYNYHDCWTCVQEEIYLPVAIFLNFFSILLCHISEILLQLEIIFFDASTSMIPTMVHNGKYLFINNLHNMG